MDASPRVPRRRALTAGTAGALFLAVIFFVAGRFRPPPFPPELWLKKIPDGAFASDPDALPAAMVEGVVDGDTLKIRWDGRQERVRLYGVDTPERGEACFDEATDRTRALAGRAVRLAFDQRGRDRHGRLLAYVFTAEGLSLDGTLAAEGLARAWTRDGRFRRQIMDLEKSARRQKRGCLWGRGRKA